MSSRNRRSRVHLLFLPVLLLCLMSCALPEIDWPAGQFAITPTSLPAAAPVTAAASATTIISTKEAKSTAIPEQTAIIPTPTVEVEPDPPLTPMAAHGPTVTSIGVSAGGRPIDGYRFGSGAAAIVLVGGIHGGYEENTIRLAQAFLDYFQAHGEEIPGSVTVHIVPNANPDGLAIVASEDGTMQPTDVITDTLPGRFNANGVDLNRNWDCRWTEQALWRDQPVSAGAYPFSEPESESLRRFFLETEPALAIFLHSAANAIYASGCPEPDLVSHDLAAIYGLAAGYPVYAAFEHYTITGDAGDWLTMQGIPSITIELSTHEAIDWEQNLAGLRALLAHFSEDGARKEEPE